MNINELKKYGLYERVCKEYSKGISTLQEKVKEKDKEKEEKKDKEKALMKEIEELFLKVDKINYNYKYERKAIYTLMNKVKDIFKMDPELEKIGIIDFVKSMIVIYAKNKNAKKKIFQNPIIPHILGSNNMFPQIMEISIALMLCIALFQIVKARAVLTTPSQSIIIQEVKDSTGNDSKISAAKVKNIVPKDILIAVIMTG